MSRGVFRCVFGLVLVGSSAVARAQAYGTGSQILVIGGASFRGRSSADQYTSNFFAPLSPTTSTTTTLIAPIDLPSGAVVESIQVLVTDLDVATDITAKLGQFSQGVATATTCGGYQAGWSGTSSGLAGTGIIPISSTPITLRHRQSCNGNDSYTQYGLEVTLESTSQSLTGAVVTWHRQLSPAPASATFNDVPASDPFFRAIEALAAAGITSGCGGGNFCPNDVVTRNQMAKFLANALGLHFGE